MIARPQDLEGPPPASDEAQRLEVLRSLHILDTPPEERFDRIVRLATRIFQTPSAYISFVEEDRQWFKARQGFAAPAVHAGNRSAATPFCSENP